MPNETDSQSSEATKLCHQFSGLAYRNENEKGNASFNKVLASIKKTKDGDGKVICPRCGTTHHLHDDPCPAYNETCSKCRKKNHFSSQCLSKKENSRKNESWRQGYVLTESKQLVRHTGQTEVTGDIKNTQKVKDAEKPTPDATAPTVAEPTPVSDCPTAEAKEQHIEQQSMKEEVRTENLVKKPLKNTWTLWYLENDRSKSWEDMQNEIISFDTVEDFWNVYNDIKTPSKIKLGSDYSLFKKGIKPMWLEGGNKHGGRWIISHTKLSKQDLDNLWLDVLLLLINESFENSDEICGAVVNLRGKNNKIAVWTAHSDNHEAILEIGHKLKEALRLDRQIVYQAHKDTIVPQSTSVKTLFSL